MNGLHTSIFRPAFIVPAALLMLLAAGAMVWYAADIRLNNNVRSALPVSGTGRSPSPVLFAASNVARGQLLAAGDFAVRPVEAGKAPEGALHNVLDAEGHMALASIGTGKPVLSSDISQDVPVGVSVHVPMGYRAYAVRISEADIAGGFLQAGDKVDLYVTLPGALFAGRQNSGGRADDQSRSMLLLQGIQVLAVGTKLKSQGTADTAARTVTLALRSEDLSKLALAARLGNVSFAIRNPADDGLVHQSIAGLGMLVSEAPRVFAFPQRRSLPPAAGITVYAGRDRSVVRVP